MASKQNREELAWQCRSCRVVVRQYRNQRLRNCPKCGHTYFTPITLLARVSPEQNDANWNERHKNDASCPSLTSVDYHTFVGDLIGG